LSAIADVMAGRGLAPHGSRSSRPSPALAAAVNQTGGNPVFVPSRTSVALTQNQGPPSFGTNLALTPTGTLTLREIRREQFVARFVGPYSVVPGRTTTEAI